MLHLYQESHRLLHYKMVISHLSSMGLELEEEFLTQSGYRLDALVQVDGKKIGVEVDGPSHFVGRKLTGGTILKRRQEYLRSLLVLGEDHRPRISPLTTAVPTQLPEFVPLPSHICDTTDKIVFKYMLKLSTSHVTTLTLVSFIIDLQMCDGAPTSMATTSDAGDGFHPSSQPYQYCTILPHNTYIKHS